MLIERTQNDMIKQDGRGGHDRFARAGVLGIALAVLLAGCSFSGIKKSIDQINTSTAAYFELQGFIHDKLTTKFDRAVRSVSCTPHVDEVVTDSSANFSCVVRFADGTSYTTQGTVTNPSTDPDTAYYTYSFTDPPPVDITTAPLPTPSVTLAPASPASLFVAANLAVAVRKLTANFNSNDLIIQLALYPGEIEAVIATSANEARAVTISYSGSLTAGLPVSFNGSRSGIEFAQLVPGAIQHLTGLITAAGGVPLAHISRFVLTNSLPGDNSGWNIYLTSGSTRFQSLVLGEHLVMITPSGTRALN